MAYLSQKVVEMVGNNGKQVQETIIDWYEVLEPMYGVQDKAVVGAV